MVSQRSRERVKHVLSVSRVKLIYARITLTRYTTLYFFLALLSCIIFICLQTGTYLNNMEGTNAVAAFLVQSNVTSSTLGMSFLQDGNVVLCKNIPGQPGANCTTLVKRVSSHMHVRDTILSFDERADSPKNTQQCALSLMWLEDVLADASREDFGTMLYHIWLLTLSIVTLLNESLPHLFAGLAARALATAWAGFRVRGNSNLFETYHHVIDAGECNEFDPLGAWWNQTTLHGMLGLVANTVNLVIVAGLSYKLFRVYASQTFSRVGASTEVNHVYKLVLMLSVILQLSGFFTLGQAALWFSKISFGAIRRLADDFCLYLAELVVIAVLVGPWLTLGWISVRRESKSLFLLFSLISLILFGMSTALFTSPLNQFVFKEWSFYATMSVTAYILLVATFILAVVCRLQFGKGLAHFLQVTDALEDGDFTPVYFSKRDDAASYIEDDTKSEFDPEKTILGLGYAYPKDEKEPQLPQPTHHHGRSLSVLPADTIKLSSTPAKLNVMTANRVSMSPIMVQPVSRSSSMKSNLSSSSPSRTKAPGLPSAVKPSAVPVLPPISVPPVSLGHARSETVDERPGRDRSTAAPAKPAQAVVRSTSVPRQGRPRRPSEAQKPGENFF